MIRPAIAIAVVVRPFPVLQLKTNAGPSSSEWIDSKLSRICIRLSKSCKQSKEGHDYTKNGSFYAEYNPTPQIYMLGNSKYLVIVHPNDIEKVSTQKCRSHLLVDRTVKGT